MRIVTYNFLAGGSGRRSGHWEELRVQLAPDILFTQESRAPPPAAPWTGGAWRRATGRGWGTGVFLTRGALAPIAVRGFRGWIAGGELDWRVRPDRPLRVFSVHCPSGKRGYVDTMDRILDRLAPLARGADLVVGGDFNVAAGYRGEQDRVRMGSGERRLLDRLTGELALIPCWQAMHPEVPLAQTLRWSGNPETPYHCDGIFLPAAWRRRLQSAEVVSGPQWDRLSDHNPVLAVVAGWGGPAALTGRSPSPGQAPPARRPPPQR